MSRCFPYPPPGYLSNGVRGEAVRDPIKIKRGRENPITELDNKKRKDKKERKEKKDKKKNGKGNKELGYVVDTYNLSEKSLLPKGKEEEAERSDLTEEHELPVCSQNVCNSPDSSGRGNKRKGDDTGFITKTHGNILRIRLPLQRHREPDATLRAEGLCSDSVKAESVPQQAETRTIPCEAVTYPVTCNSEVSSQAVKDACVSDLKVKENKAKTDSISLHRKKEHKVESLYKALIVNWMPPSLEMDQGTSDDSWLRESKDQGLGCKRLKLSHGDQPCHESSCLWPYARYILEADVYALPYSVPF